VLVMKDAFLPQVRVESGLRADLEAVLHKDETLSEFVEASVRSAVEYRRVQTSFLERGEAAWQRHLVIDEAVPAEEVIARLQAKLDAKRKKLKL
jgi:hypothetical protein